METANKHIHQDIIERCRKGERESQFQLYKLYYKAMYNTCLRIVGNEYDAEDIMQETFLKAFRKIGSYEGKAGFGAWLKKIAIHSALDFLKKNKVVFEEINEAMPFPEEDTTEADNGAATIGEIRKTIMKLPEGYRVIFSLYYLEGYDHEEISEILKINPGTSRSQLLRAKRKLLEMIGECAIRK